MERRRRSEPRVLFRAPRRVTHICDVWTSCHGAALQGQGLCLQEQELSEITGGAEAWQEE